MARPGFTVQNLQRPQGCLLPAVDATAEAVGGPSSSKPKIPLTCPTPEIGDLCTFRSPADMHVLLKKTNLAGGHENDEADRNSDDNVESGDVC
jgi:hypothetical protein